MDKKANKMDFLVELNGIHAFLEDNLYS